MNTINYAWPPESGWSGTCMIDQAGNVYPCSVCGHEQVSKLVLGVSAWVACRLGWVRIGLSYVEARKRLTDDQQDAIAALYGLAMRGQTNLARSHDCMLRLLSGEIGEFYESQEVLDDTRLTGTCR